MRRPLFSDRVRQFDCTTFKALSIGQRFRFGSEVDFPASGMVKGVAIKLSPRRYRFEGTQEIHQVGSISAVVLKVNDQGEPIRLGHFTPYLGD